MFNSVSIRESLTLKNDTFNDAFICFWGKTGTNKHVSSFFIFIRLFSKILTRALQKGCHQKINIPQQVNTKKRCAIIPDITKETSEHH